MQILYLMIFPTAYCSKLRLEEKQAKDEIVNLSHPKQINIWQMQKAKKQEKVSHIEQQWPIFPSSKLQAS